MGETWYRLKKSYGERVDCVEVERSTENSVWCNTGIIDYPNWNSRVSRHAIRSEDQEFFNTTEALVERVNEYAQIKKDRAQREILIADALIEAASGIIAKEGKGDE